MVLELDQYWLRQWLGAWWYETIIQIDKIIGEGLCANLQTIS